MKDLYIVANWKENKTVAAAIEFLEDFKTSYEPRENVTVVICSSFLSVTEVKNFIQSDNLKVEVGVQDISQYKKGPHTGEISAAQAAEFAKYVILGHSERRAIGETNETVSQKAENAISKELTPIVCVQNETTPIPENVLIVAYEPIEAIGTGNPDTPENAQKVAAQVKEKNSEVLNILYGGSVTSENVRTFTEMPDISGVLVGGASLDPHEFSELIKNA